MFGSAYGTAAVLAAVAVMLSTPGPSCGNGWDDNGPNAGYIGHSGPAWGRVDEVDVIVFGWDGDHDPADDYIDRRRNAESRGSIYMVRADGSGLTLLSPDAGDGRDTEDDGIAYDASPATSPDGTRVTYTTLRHGGGWSYDIVVASLDGRERERLTGGGESQTQPVWSPNGTRIAFLQNGYLHTMTPDGSDVHTLVPDIPVVREPPAWSPDGTRLAFRQSGRHDELAWLYVSEADGSRLTRVAEVGSSAWPTGAWRPVWSPDGRFIAFVTVGEHQNLLFPALSVVDVGSGEVTTLVWGGFGPFLWSPDGAEIFYGSRATSSDQEDVSESGLFAVALHGDHEIRRVTGPENAVLGLAWSPDGTRLVVRIQPFRTDASPDVYPFARYADIVLYTVARDGSDMRVLAREGAGGDLVTADRAPANGD